MNCITFLCSIEKTYALKKYVFEAFVLLYFLPTFPLMKQDDTINKQIDSASEELQEMCNLLSEETRTWLQKFSRPKEEFSDEITEEEEEIDEVDPELN